MPLFFCIFKWIFFWSGRFFFRINVARDLSTERGQQRLKIFLCEQNPRSKFKFCVLPNDHHHFHISSVGSQINRIFIANLLENCCCFNINMEKWFQRSSRSWFWTVRESYEKLFERNVWCKFWVAENKHKNRPVGWNGLGDGFYFLLLTSAKRLVEILSLLQ